MNVVVVEIPICYVKMGLAENLLDTSLRTKDNSLITEILS